MKTVLTFKELCLMYVDNNDRSLGGGSDSGVSGSGYNPLYPNLESGGYSGKVYVGKYYDMSNKFDPTVPRKLKSTKEHIEFDYVQNGNTKTRTLLNVRCEIYKIEELLATFNQTQTTEFEKQTEGILTKMNLTRTTPDKVELKKEDCIVIRNFREDTLNYRN